MRRAFHWNRLVVLAAVAAAIIVVLAVHSQEQKEPTVTEVSVFTDRNREVYVEGEFLEVNVVIPPGISGKLRILLKEEGTILPIHEGTIGSESVELRTLSFLVDTEPLKPAAYELSVQVGGRESNTIPIQIVDRKLATNMIILYNTWYLGSMVQGVHEGTLFDYPYYGDVDYYCDTMEQNGVNLINDTYPRGTMNFPHPKHVSMEEFRNANFESKGILEDIRKKSQSGPYAGEVYYQPGFAQYYLDEMLRRKISWMAVARDYDWDYDQYRDRDAAGYTAHKLQVMLQVWRKSPAFLGFTYNGRETNLGGLQGARKGKFKEAEFQERFQVPFAVSAQHYRFYLEYRKKYPDEYASVDVRLIEEKNRLMANSPLSKESLARVAQINEIFLGNFPDVKQKYEEFKAANPKATEEKQFQVLNDILKEKETFYYYRDLLMKYKGFSEGLYSEIFRTYNAAVNEVSPHYVRTDERGSNAMPLAGTFVEDFHSYDTLNVVKNNIYTDHGSWPMAEIFQRNIFGRQAQLQGKPYWANKVVLWQHGNVMKKWMFQLWGSQVQGIGIDAYGGFYCERYSCVRDAIRAAVEFGKCYGDMMMSLKRENRVAVLLSDYQLNFTAQYLPVYEVIYDCGHAGFPVDVIFDDDVRAGRLKEYKVLLVIGITEREPSLLAEIREYAASGGVVYADNDTLVKIEGARKLEMSFNDYPRWGGLHVNGKNMGGDIEFRRMYAATAAKIPALRKILRQHLTPFADSDQRDILCSTLTYQDSKYVFAVNDSLAPYGWAQTALLPCRGQLSVEKGNYVVYDLIRQKEVVPSQEGGRNLLPLDLVGGEAEVYAFLPARIAAVDLAVPKSCRTGSVVECEVQVLDGNGAPIKGLIPIEITVLDSRGRVRHVLYRAVSGSGPYVDYFKIAANDGEGRFKVTARELFSNITVSREIEVKAGFLRPSVVAMPEAVVCEPQAVKAFFDKKTATILLDSFYGEMYLDDAENLKRLLESRGIKCSIVREKVFHRINPADVHATYLGPNMVLPYNVILLGDPEYNRVHYSLFSWDMPLRRFSSNYPGKGRALIQPCYGAFGIGYGSLSVAYSDGEGRARAFSALQSLLRGQQPQAAITLVPPLMSEFRVRDVFDRYAANNCYSKNFAIVRATDSDRSDAVAAQERGFVVGPGWRAPVLAISPDGRHLAVGKDSLGYNCFLMDNQGAVLWKTKCGEEEIASAAVGANGLVAFTAVTPPDDANHKPYLYDTYVYDLKGNPQYRFDGYSSMEMDKAGNYLITGGDFITLVKGSGEILKTFSYPGTKRFYSQYNTHKWIWTSYMTVGMSGDGNRAVFSVFTFEGPLTFTINAITKNSTKVAFVDTATQSILWEKEITGDRYGERPFTTPNGPGCMTDFALTPDGSRVAMVSNTGKLFLFNAQGEQLFYREAGVPRFTYYSDIYCVPQVEMTSDGQVIVASGGLGTVCAYDSSGKELWRRQHPFLANITDLKISPDNTKLAVMSWMPEVFVYDIKGKFLWKKKCGAGQRAVFSPDSAFLYVGTRGGEVYCLGSGDGKTVWEKSVTDETYAPDIEKMLDVCRSTRRLVKDRKDIGVSYLRPQAAEFKLNGIIFSQTSFVDGGVSEKALEAHKQILAQNPKDFSGLFNAAYVSQCLKKYGDALNSTARR